MLDRCIIISFLSFFVMIATTTSTTTTKRTTSTSSFVNETKTSKQTHKQSRVEDAVFVRFQVEQNKRTVVGEMRG